jgi:predicted RNase H-like HicB family nuclease
MAYYVAILDGAGDVWGVRIPDLPGCYGCGASPEAAIADATSAALEWASDAIADGQRLPPPRRVQEVIADPHAEFDPAKGESLVMIPLALETVAGG